MTFDIGRGILFRNEDVMNCLFFLCILMQIPHPDAGCPYAYLHLAGDVPGGGSLNAHTSVATISTCSGHCDSDSNCCSFEYSWTEENCYLNTECRPTAVVWRDYYFCVKGIDLCICSIVEPHTLIPQIHN